MGKTITFAKVAISAGNYCAGIAQVAFAKVLSA
jgi:hypothetical protein